MPMSPEYLNKCVETQQRGLRNDGLNEQVKTWMASTRLAMTMKEARHTKLAEHGITSSMRD